MARQINRLSPLAVARASEPGMMLDGAGLYLQVSKRGWKSWIYRFMLNGQSRDMGLGALHTISLAEARVAATECRKLVREGIDPIDKREAAKLADRAAAAKALTFEQCTDAYIEAHEASWRNAKHASQWRNTLKTYAHPVLGNLPVSSIDTGLVLQVLEPIWNTKTETASRVRGRIENILDWATVRNLREGENPARWRGHLNKTLPARSKVQKVSHHSAMPYDDIGSFMTVLRTREGISARALEFLILTAARTGEAIGARWDEINYEKGVWTIPAERTKTEIEHRVPLSDAAISVVRSLPIIDGSDFIFPGARRGRPLSNMALLKLLERMEHGDVTAHGFRSTFRDWAAERTAYPREVAEKALAHTVKNKAEAAYQRGDMIDKRRKLMNAWAEFCAIDTKRRGNVTPIRNEAV